LELADSVGELERPLYYRGAVNILEATDKIFCNWDVSYDSIVQNGISSYHDKKFSYQVPIIYGDYFFLEAILRLLGKGEFLW
jgi:unsaturated chondroitin disaccharide hydrolase